MMTVGEYLDAVARMHGLSYRAMARALKVSPTMLLRWRREATRPSWRRIQTMTTLWGGDARVILLGTLLKRYGQETGLSLKEVRSLVTRRERGGRGGKRQGRRHVDKSQLRLPIL